MVYNGAEVDVKPQFGGLSMVLSSTCGNEQKGVVSPEDSLPVVNEDKLDNTAYNAVAEYCEKNHYAVDEHKVIRYWYYKDGDKMYVLCEMAATFMNLDKSPDGIGSDEQTDISVRSDDGTLVTLEDYMNLDLERALHAQKSDSTQGAVVFLLALDV